MTSAAHWEQRWHPLRGEWVVVAAHRQDRPWSGETLADERASPPEFDPQCYLCPGNVRVSGAVNPDYRDVFVFDNDHPCVGADAPWQLSDPPRRPDDDTATAGPGRSGSLQEGVYRNRPASGVARVICYDPRHNASLGELSDQGAERLVHAWREQTRELGAREDVRHVLIFENRGEAVGVSNPHPHGQIYATNFVFKTIEIEAQRAEAHLASTGRRLLEDIVAIERHDGRRMILENEHAVAFIPYFARYAYETFVCPKICCGDVTEMSPEAVRGFAVLLRELVCRFDELWASPFPYVMALHQKPTDGGAHPGFGFHIEFHPPLRKPNLRKYLAGPELGGGNFISDTWPESKARELREAGG